MALTEKTQIYDIDLDGGSTVLGTLPEVYDSAAISNALRMWLLSFKGDYINSDVGGPLAPYIDKPMSEETKRDMVQSIFSGLKNDFPEIEVLSLNIDPNYEKRFWSIKLLGFSNVDKIGFLAEERVRSFS